MATMAAAPSTTSSFHFTVAGSPVSKGRARVWRKPNGELGRPYTPQKTRTYEGIVRSAAIDAMHGAAPLAGAINLTLNFYFAIPQSWPQWKKDDAAAGRILPTTKPDLDNIEKAVKDGLNGVVYIDDCQVVACTKAKWYSARPRVDIEVDLLNVAPAQATKRGQHA